MPATTRPRSSPAKPNRVITTAAARGRTTGPRTATDGTALTLFLGVLAFQAVERLADRARAVLETGDHLGRSLVPEVRVVELRLDLRQVVLELLALLVAPRVAGAGGKRDATRGGRKRRSLVERVDQLDLRQPRSDPRRRVAHSLELQRPAARGRSGGLAMTANLFDDRDHARELLLRVDVDVAVLEVWPLRPHQVLAVARQARPELLGHERHEGMQQPEEVVEAEIGDVQIGRAHV